MPRSGRSVNALTRIGERLRERERYGREVRCDLVLLLDQLDELFAPSLPADHRERFADVMAALVASGRVWLVATLRADLYQSMLAVSALKAMKDAGASYGPRPPGTGRTRRDRAGAGESRRSRVPDRQGDR